ncbi:hypothetical protein Taro_028940 [Colocasia esculenta]|uniref:Uncharacterized protein n=1 Tax=Colocasia esculenta TaxID=4460 RepID=A0A843VMJ5_COLES|nr:hypothetical protein [Colocasia esculenta]
MVELRSGRHVENEEIPSESRACVDTSRGRTLERLEAPAPPAPPPPRIRELRNPAKLWSIIEDGDLLISKPKEEWTDEDIKKISLNNKAKSFMCCALTRQEFNRISACKSVKEMWDKLKLTYEGKDKVKETRIDILVT